MAKTRSSKISTKDLSKIRLRGPTCLRPLTKDRLAVKHKTPWVRPPVWKRPNSHGSHPTKCVRTTYTLNIDARPNVAIIDDLETAVRTISSPCGNFVWGASRALSTVPADEDHDTVPIGSADDANGNKVKTLQIVLHHTNQNHDGNVFRDTIAMFQPTPWEPRDLSLEQQEVISIDQILNEIRGWKDKVQRCFLRSGHVQEYSVMVRDGPAFPNGMGNEKRYPPPWDVTTWNDRIAERKAKELTYKAKSTKRPSTKRLSKIGANAQ